ncbi:bifunctional folylpolyglutamate synthase/dihydrofolate synthase [Schaalia sp. lx-260]|uniref:bifunctional folylpolyglutamate synthase/dihydrofolate synthase n=1 Tax=Schaalia sp. lx-260 TaxID=2899082 RepID=UPI001E3C8181|nr:folylpolyglutamate synthase/dihydrofolate synthase family protein [Schaalia sp. lx-260]MCD4549295.1 bifunctional folylpolyglutamate synthase/dihydrofolate synthase [Schaalia sp. lx-260]
MANEHPAFFGNDEQESQGNIPLDLLPYLEVSRANSDEEKSQIQSEDESDAVRAAALRALVENSLLIGSDPQLLAELEGKLPEGEEWIEDIEADRQEREHLQALDAAAEDAALMEQVNQIYQSVIARAPEHDIDPTLSRVQAVLDILGDPQNTYPSVHITGTNGKTSTSRMVDALLGAAGMKVGRFTSPHLRDVRERLSLENQPISPAGFIAAWQDVAPYIDMVDARSRDNGGSTLSFFEVFTVMALAAFADYPVDAAVIEVGMGGRWDATNVIDADVSIITSISRDHEKWLGTDICDIAREKAGIIKPGQVVVIAEQDPEVLEILLARAREVDAVARVEKRDYEVVDRQLGVGGQLVTVRTPSAVYEDVFVPLLGQHQAHNAAAAIVAVEAFLGGRAIDGRLLEDGMLQVTSPGRLQVIRSSPTIIVDAAHNPGGAHVLAQALEESFGFRRIVGVFSAMGDKDVEGILSEVEAVFDHLVLVPMDGERAMPLEDMQRIAVDVFGPDRVDVHDDLVEAIDRAVHIAESTTDSADSAGVVVFGSVVLAGHVIDMIQARKGK